MDRNTTLKSRLAQFSRRAQSGQVIILMAFGMIALLAVLGLAVDGGRLYFLERDAQNASDAAVLAATHALCTGGDPQQAALDAAAANGFIASEITISSPPSRALADASANPNDYAEVIINADIPSYFIHLVYGGDLAVSTYALGHCSTALDWQVDGRAIMATDSCEGGCRAVMMNGSDLYIEGGIATNGSIQTQGARHQVVGPVDYGNACSVAANNTTWDAGNPVCLPPGVTFEMPQLYDIADFRPGGPVDLQYRSQGLYHEVSGSINWDDYPNGGIFYAPGDISVGAIYRNLDFAEAPRITVVAEGSIKGNGPRHRIKGFYDNGLALFSNALDEECSRGHSSPGIQLSGSSTQWHGLIYAPRGAVSMPGSQAEALTGAIVARNIKITGSHTYIVYDYTVLPDPEKSIEITQ